MKNTNTQNADIRTPYDTPELRVHGNIAQLTQGASTNGRRDNAHDVGTNKS